MLRTFIAIPLAVLSAGLVVAIGCLTACYPKQCDPRTDPLKCQCPPGACGDYPTTVRDAGRD